MNKSIFIIVPAYNEEAVIGSVLGPLIDLGYSVVVVDDGSKDKTWAVLQALPVYAIKHPVNLGQGAALQTGMAFARKKGADIVVQFDADGQHRVEDIAVLSEPIRKGEADVVLGSRFLRKEDRLAVPRSKRLLLRGAVLVNGLMTGIWLSDAHNGFRALNRKAIEKIHLKESGYAHASEILSQIRQHKLRYVERPTSIIYSEYSKSKGQSSWNGIRILIDLILRRLFR